MILFCTLAFGNPQWNKWIFIAQNYYIFPWGDQVITPDEKEMELKEWKSWGINGTLGRVYTQDHVTNTVIKKYYNYSDGTLKSINLYKSDSLGTVDIYPVIVYDNSKSIDRRKEFGILID